MEEESKPITLYVEKIDTNPTLILPKHPRVSIVDIELHPNAAEELAKFLNEHNHGPAKGTVRVRLTGRLVVH